MMPPDRWWAVFPKKVGRGTGHLTSQVEPGLNLFRTVEADGPQCRRYQALSYWGSGGGLEWVG
jgi:hypothetical protein